MIKVYMFSLLMFSVACAQNLFWYDGGLGKLIKKDTISSTATDICTGINSGFGVAVDVSNNYVFWTNHKTNSIWRSNLSGGSAVKIIDLSSINGIPRGIALDKSNQKIFWTDNYNHKVYCAKYNGSYIKNISTNAGGFVAFDTKNSKVYWADNTSGIKTIYRCDTTGNNKVSVITGLGQVWGIALNSQQDTLYWADNDIAKIQKACISGTMPATKIDLVSGLSEKVRGMVYSEDQKRLYWSTASGKIFYIKYLNKTVLQFYTAGMYIQGIAYDAEQPLPVTLSNFRSEVKEGVAILKWTTLTELNNDKFIIQRKNNETWINIGEVLGSGISNSEKHYSYNDKLSSNGKFTYRIMQVDYNGSLSFSNEIVIENTLPADFTMEQNYPNPFNPSTVIKYSLPRESFVKIQLYNLTGELIKSLVEQKKEAGTYTVEFDGKNYPSGIYIYRISAGAFCKTMKMMLVK